VRNAIALTSGRPSDSVPTSGPVLAAVAHLLGYRQPADLLEEYRRTTRRARGVVERVFYG
jgi:glutamate-ammonia-ligase adenylyltransferase